MSKLTITAFAAKNPVASDDDIVDVVADALSDAGATLHHGDIVTVASKIVAKSEGRLVPCVDKQHLVTQQSRRIVAERSTATGYVTRVVESAAGPIMAAAGIDESDVPAGQVLLLPHDADASADRLRSALLTRYQLRSLGVIITDTSGRPWRAGVTDFALGASGVVVLEDARGKVDIHGRELTVTIRAVADEIAAASDLVKDKLTGRPVAVIRGLSHLVLDSDDLNTSGQGRDLVRAESDDWFALGPYEAIRNAIGAPPGKVSPKPIDHASDSAQEKVHRTLDVVSSYTPQGVIVRDGDHPLTLQLLAPNEFDAGMAMQRLLIAATNEDLEVTHYTAHAMGNTDDGAPKFFFDIFFDDIQR